MHQVDWSAPARFAPLFFFLQDYASSVVDVKKDSSTICPQDPVLNEQKARLVSAGNYMAASQIIYFQSLAR
ncbi:hypothetical protein OUZ56_027283 [Daphnia magna]|uniref:Uncharacterized protein n=1 Tax=Daphnia magna TaxID=35525 RepID=A0ABQ9ZPB9_9CRUS|nr:hypothetical protein OUZ56_027283 [Daphnia magna]